MKLSTVKLLVPIVAVSIQSNSASTVIGGFIAQAAGIAGVFVVGSAGSTGLFLIGLFCVRRFCRDRGTQSVSEGRFKTAPTSI